MSVNMNDGATIQPPRTVGIEFPAGRPTINIRVDDGSIWLEPGHAPENLHFVFSIRNDAGQRVGTLTLDTRA